ncbi:hypothetical protein INT45_011150 [Circinella minor]|uniref:Uncharacterized protein n=1 Tax=Circinella minor TaxID=1195481 RepID=A0A8H7SHT9_9FUNG|nr:hypothetical protein INT45_011150 [Circinella minor]
MIACGDENSTYVSATKNIVNNRTINNESTISRTTAIEFSAMESSLLEHYREYVTTGKNDKLTEQDYLVTIWHPIFSELFKSCDDIPKIRLKWRIYISIHNQRKEEILPFKRFENSWLQNRYFRIIADVENQKCDVVAAELAKQDNVKKIIDNEAKLSREGKDVINYLAKLPITGLRLMCWLIQIVNCQCLLSTIHLVSDGLCTTVPQFDQLALPKSFNDMDCIESTLKALVTMENSIRKLADLIPAAYAKKEKPREHFGRSSEKLNYTDWLRGTFYTPPTACEPRLPINLFGRKPSDLGNKLLKTEYADELPDQLPNSSGTSPDKFGWLYVPPLQKYYNTITRTYSDDHPFNRCRNPISPISSSASSSTAASSSK